MSAGALPSGSVWFESSRNVSPNREPVTPRAYALGEAKIFGSSRARKIFASLVRVQSERSLQVMKSVATPPYAGAGALPSGPRAYALGGITVFYFLARSEKPSPRCVESRATVACGVVEIFGSSRARKNRHPAVSSPGQQRITEGNKDDSSRARKIFASLVRVQSERSLQVVNE